MRESTFLCECGAREKAQKLALEIALSCHHVVPCGHFALPTTKKSKSSLHVGFADQYGSSHLVWGWHTSADLLPTCGLLWWQVNTLEWLSTCCWHEAQQISSSSLARWWYCTKLWASRCPGTAESRPPSKGSPNSRSQIIILITLHVGFSKKDLQKNLTRMWFRTFKMHHLLHKTYKPWRTCTRHLQIQMVRASSDCAHGIFIMLIIWPIFILELLSLMRTGGAGRTTSLEHGEHIFKLEPTFFSTSLHQIPTEAISTERRMATSSSPRAMISPDVRDLSLCTTMEVRQSRTLMQLRVPWSWS